MLQFALPDDLCGRITAVWLVQANSAPLLGNVESGVVAAATNARISATSGGLACLLGVFMLALMLPAFRRFRYAGTGGIA
jgi:hypothetical protein